MLRLLITSAFVLLASGCSGHERYSVVVRNVNLVDLDTGNSALTNIGVRDGHIEFVSGSDIHGETTVDGTGLWAIPGLWDMHVHISDPHFLNMMVALGIVGVRDMGGDVTAPTNGCESIEASQLLQWRSEVENGARIGPHLAIAGPHASGTGWPTSLPVKTPDEARAAVAEIQERGADFVKVYEQIPRDAYLALMDEARARQLTVAGHVDGDMLTIIDALTAGQRSIEHVRDHLLVCFARDDEEITGFYDEAGVTEVERAWGERHRTLCPDIWEQLRQGGTWLTPTLSVSRTWVEGEKAGFEADPRRARLPQSIRDDVVKFSQSRREQSELERSKGRLWWSTKLAFVKRANDEGAAILAGSDAACEGVIPGYGLLDELNLLVEAGLTPLEALQTATIEPAAYFDQAERRGRLQAGYEADILLLKADPRKDIAAVRQLEVLILRGEVFDRKMLDTLLRD